MMDETQGNIRDWLWRNNLSGAACCDGRTYATYRDTGAQVGASKQYSEPLQGCANDCFFIAALVSVAWAANSKLKNYPNYQFYNTTTNSWDPQFSINSYLGVDSSNRLVFGRSSTAYIWPCLYEKAYAKWKDSAHSDTPNVATILNGGNGITALLNIMGGQKSSTNTMPAFPAPTYKTQYPTIAKTNNSPGAGLTANHTYSVLRKNGTNYELRNPCGGGTVPVSSTDFPNKFTEWGYVIPP